MTTPLPPLPKLFSQVEHPDPPPPVPADSAVLLPSYLVLFVVGLWRFRAAIMLWRSWR